MIKNKKIMIIAHRGASACESENTMAAFKAAVKMKADGIECDVRMTADKRLAIIHDATIDRTTSGKGKVKDYTLNQLKQYNIPELQEIINLIKLSGLLLLIEIKERGTEQQIVSVIRKNKIENKVMIISFYADSIKNIKKLSNIKTGLIFSKLDRSIETALASKADWILPKADIATARLVKSAHKAHLRVLIWTVDDVSKARKLVALGTDGIITNLPKGLFEMLKEQEGL